MITGTVSWSRAGTWHGVEWAVSWLGVVSQGQTGLLPLVNRSWTALLFKSRCGRLAQVSGRKSTAYVFVCQLGPDESKQMADELPPLKSAECISPQPAILTQGQVAQILVDRANL